MGSTVAVNKYFAQSICQRYLSEVEVLRFSKLNDRPAKYPLDVYLRFIEWVQDNENQLNRIIADGLISNYVGFLKEANPSSTTDIVNLDGLGNMSILSLSSWTTA